MIVAHKGKIYKFKKLDNNTWESLTPIDGYIWYIPVGFLTDFRSGGRFLDRFIPKFSLAFVVHDYLYQRGAVERRGADAIQNDLLKEDPNFNTLQRLAVYAAVRLFGGKYWRYYREGGEFPYKA